MSLGLVAALILVPSASASDRWTADSKRGDQTITVPCPDGTTATVTLQAAQLLYDKPDPVQLEQAQYVRVGAFGAPGTCATEMRFEVITPPKVENFGDFDHISCTLGAGSKKTCDLTFGDKGPHGGDYVEQDDKPETWFAVPETTASTPLRLEVPYIPRKVYKTFGKAETASGRAQIAIFVRPRGTTQAPETALTSVGLWTAGGFAGPFASVPKTISRSALAAGRVRISVGGAEGQHVTIKLHAGKMLIATGHGRLPESGKLKVRLHPRAAIPASARKVSVDVEVENSGLGDHARLTA
jgi:hypothetical protein